MKELRNSVRKLIGEELMRANEQFPLFRSDHEAVGVIAEEVEEMRTEAINTTSHYEWFKMAVFDDFDFDVKKEAIDNIEMTATELACEAVQVAAMARKWKMSNKGGNDE